ncbi:MAG: nucleoside-diphosphate sugar epimerase [Omnitrophica WOR_2 bacterium RIFCSPHIGHO2_02_FULL_68_15]|nr:MAG: nucleoside-diphosphate sugar epimerase [Omnitrophica WOR_2 bacterium RIFCSPHIGHO2_02_FULL_68_15]
MKALITGGAGFIGSHLTEVLVKRGDHVTVLDNLSTGRYENLAHLDGHPDLQVVVGTILNETLVDKLVERCDVIFHLAAAVGVELIIKKPLESMMTNIRGSEVVLEMAHRYRKKVLIASTSEIYGKNTNSLLREDTDRVLGSPLKTRWSYSTSKAVDEILAYVYWKEKGVPTVIVRLFNTVGPRQSGAYGMVIPRFVSQALAGKPLQIHGDGKQSRCFLHVSDVVHALTRLMEHPGAVGQVFNLGSQEEVTIDELAKRIIRLAGGASRIEYIPYEQAYEEGYEDMPRRVPDIAKVGALIGFQPTMDLDQIIRSVVASMGGVPATPPGGQPKRRPRRTVAVKARA